MTWCGRHRTLSLLEWTRSVEPLAQTTWKGDDMTTAARRIRKMVFDDEAFSRLDETDDRVFYTTDRFVSHLDRAALRTVEQVIDRLVIEDRPVLLDLMASWDSHLSERLQSGRTVGIGLNPRELAANTALDERVIHDLNADPHLPFPDRTFDVIVNTVSVDYLTQPFEIFGEVVRVLRPGGLFLVLFSNRMFTSKAVKVWRESSNHERMLLIQDYFAAVPEFGPTRTFASQGQPRPENDHYAGVGLPSDPVFAVWAERRGGPASRPERPLPAVTVSAPWGSDEVVRRKKLVAETRACPRCGSRLRRWSVPQTPFTEWDTEYMFVCFDDTCPFYLRGWGALHRQGNFGFSHRFMYDPDRHVCTSVPVHGPTALRDGIVDED
jgi:SAM-dependent methyltransferase